MAAAFDLRTLEPGRTLEVDTPHAAFTIEHAGYYRVAVGRDNTSFIARRAGRATVTPAGGAARLPRHGLRGRPRVAGAR